MTRERDPVRLSLGTLRGEAFFLPIAVSARALLTHYSFREIHRQPIPLNAQQTERLWRILEERVHERRPYSYQPVFDNCSTRLRDMINEASEGALQRNSRQRGGASLRTLAEAGLSGQVLPLLLTELAAGAAIDGPSSQWDRMAFPSELLRGVADGLAAPATLVHPAATGRLPTSVHAGRVALLLFSLVLALGSLRSRAAARRVWAGIVGGVLGVLGLVPVLGQLSMLPSLHNNWLLGVVCVSDLALVGLCGRPRSLYIAARLGFMGLLTLSSLVGLIAQPLLVPALCAALPLAATWYRSRAAG